MNKKQLTWKLGLFFTFFSCTLFALVLSLRTMPTAEGWYTEYAWQINHGNLPYRDFEYLFFPFYIYLIAGITKIFGYNIIVLRIFGVFLFGGIAVAFYWLFTKLFDNFTSMVAAILATLFLQSEVVQVFYDYIRVHDLFLLIATICLVNVTMHCLRDNELTQDMPIKVSFNISTILLVIAGISAVIYSFINKTFLLLMAMSQQTVDK